jgi:hypothetical protein
MFTPKYNKNQIYEQYKRMIEGAKMGIVPEFTMYYVHELKNFFSRNEYIEISWSIVTAEVAKQISDIVKGMYIHGIYSGSGLWEEFLKCYHDMPVVATDKEGNNDKQLRFREIIKSKASDSIDLIEDVPNTCLFMSWPKLDCEDVTKAVTKYRNKGGKKIIFIGEGYDGCTGCKSLWKEELDEYWKEEEYIMIPQWDGLNDYVQIYTLN